MADQQALEALFREHGYSDFRWLDPKQVVVAHWVRMKCTYGCSGYGKRPTCPPHVPSVSECRQFFDEYTTGVILHFEQAFDKPEDRSEWTAEVNRGLVALERATFLKGYEKAFLLFMAPCRLCRKCEGTTDGCKHPEAARPVPESLAVDVFSTARQAGYPIEVLTEYTQAMNRYALLLIE